MNSIFLPALPLSTLPLPAFEERVPAGFPSPAADHVQRRLDLNQRLIRDPAATFFVRAAGDSMRDAGIADGAILVVDCGRTPVSGDIVVAAVDGQHTVKRLYRRGGRIELQADNAAANYPVLKADESLQIFGVVTACITEFSRPSRRTS